MSMAASTATATNGDRINGSTEPAWLIAVVFVVIAVVVGWVMVKGK